MDKAKLMRTINTFKKKNFDNLESNRPWILMLNLLSQRASFLIFKDVVFFPQGEITENFNLDFIPDYFSYLKELKLQF